MLDVLQPKALLSEAKYPDDPYGHDWKGFVLPFEEIFRRMDNFSFVLPGSRHSRYGYGNLGVSSNRILGPSGKIYYFILICSNCGYPYNPESPVESYPIRSCNEYVVDSVHSHEDKHL